jgi:molybdopterin/thiamine biosynthesis adenylyltransferase
MPGMFHHEQLYRGPDAVARLAALRVTLCGAGAVGSQLADNLVRQGLARLRAIDFDRIEEHNVSTQLYGESEVGTFKAEALRNRLFRATGVEVDAVRKELTGSNARVLLKDADLVIDAFDNAAARDTVQRTVRAAGTPCLHVGLSAGYGEVIWDERYRVPADVGPDACDYPLARNLVLLTVAVASEAVVRFATAGERRDWSVTLGDFAVRELEGCA